VKAGDRVRVYPFGSPELAAIGTVVMISANHCSVAISFGEQHVPFMTSSTGMAIHMDHGKMFLASRQPIEVTWTETFLKGRYKIKKVSAPAE
jgi:hypothetical protein